MRAERLGGAHEESEPQKSNEVIRQEAMAKHRAELPIQASYTPSAEKMSNVAEDEQPTHRGEHSVILSDKEGSIRILSDYQDMLESNPQTNSEELSKYPDVKSAVENVVFQLALVDASRGQVLDGSEKSSQFCNALEAFNNLEGEARQIAFSTLDVLDKGGNALRLMIHNYNVVHGYEDSNEQAADQPAEQSAEQSVEQPAEDVEDKAKRARETVTNVNSYYQNAKNIYANLIKENETLSAAIQNADADAAAESLGKVQSTFLNFAEQVNQIRIQIDTNRDALPEEYIAQYDKMLQQFDTIINTVNEKLQESQDNVAKLEQQPAETEETEQPVETDEQLSQEIESKVQNFAENERKGLTSILDMSDELKRYFSHIQDIVESNGDPDDARQLMSKYEEQLQKIQQVAQELSGSSAEMRNVLEGSKDKISAENLTKYENTIRHYEGIYDNIQNAIKESAGMADEMKQKIKQLEANKQPENEQNDEEKERQVRKVREAMDILSNDSKKFYAKIDDSEHWLNHYSGYANEILDYNGDPDDARSMINRATDNLQEIQHAIKKTDDLVQEMRSVYERNKDALPENEADEYRRTINRHLLTIDDLRKKASSKANQIDDMEQRYRRLRNRKEYGE